MPPQSLLKAGAALAGQSVLQAGGQTAIVGGSFGTTLRNDLVANAAAAGAFAIGNAAQSMTSGLRTVGGELAYVGAHLVLGCAAGVASGQDCGGGALGGAVSAAMANTIATAVTGGQGMTDQGQLAATTAATMLLGGAVVLLGQNANAAALAAQNETLNNTCAAGHNCGTLASAVKKKLGIPLSPVPAKPTTEVEPGQPAPLSSSHQATSQTLTVRPAQRG